MSLILSLPLALILAFQDFPRSTIFQDILGNLGDFGRFWKVFLEDRGFWKSWKPAETKFEPQSLEDFGRFLEHFGFFFGNPWNCQISEIFLEDFGKFLGRFWKIFKYFCKILECFLEIFGIYNLKNKSEKSYLKFSFIVYSHLEVWVH